VRNFAERVAKGDDQGDWNRSGVGLKRQLALLAVFAVFGVAGGRDMRQEIGNGRPEGAP
jgi:hypothetical protein